VGILSIMVSDPARWARLFALRGPHPQRCHPTSANRPRI